MKHFALLCILILSAVSRSACAEDKPPALAAAKAAFTKADEDLNIAWSAAKKAMFDSEFSCLKEEQKNWIAYRDEMALAADYNGRPPDEKAARQSPAYYSFLADLTGSRAAWLKGLMAEHKDNSLTGVWDDSYGGELEIVEQDGNLYFSLQVVRGRTAATGEIAGIAHWNNPIGWFSDKGLDKTKTDETNLAFVFTYRKLQITGANTHSYGGERAYFDGDYVKVKPLDAKGQARVLKEAKTGESL